VFVEHTAGLDLLLALSHFQKSVGPVELFIVAKEGSHIFRLHADLVMLAALSWASDPPWKGKPYEGIVLAA